MVKTLYCDYRDCKFKSCYSPNPYGGIVDTFDLKLNAYA